VRDGTQYYTVRLDERLSDRGPLASDKSGVLTLRLERKDSRADIRRLTVNVQAAESDLLLATHESLSRDFSQGDTGVSDVASLTTKNIDPAEFSWSHGLLFFVLAILLIEQLLAYIASCHPATRSIA
jgi:hypothetical protein